MKANEKKELHTKSVIELKKLLKDAYDALLSLRLEKEQAKLSSTSLLFLKRREIAVLQTILREKSAFTDASVGKGGGR